MAWSSASSSRGSSGAWSSAAAGRGRGRRGGGLGDGCHRRLTSAAQEQHRDHDGKPEYHHEHESGDEASPLDDCATGLGGVDRAGRRGRSARGLAPEVARGQGQSLGGGCGTLALDALRGILAPVQVRDVAEPVVERLLVGRRPDRACRALRTAATCLTHVSNARRLLGEHAGIRAHRRERKSSSTAYSWISRHDGTSCCPSVAPAPTIESWQEVSRSSVETAAPSSMPSIPTSGVPGVPAPALSIEEPDGVGRRPALKGTCLGCRKG